LWRFLKKEDFKKEGSLEGKKGKTKKGGEEVFF
jgi:hypothetical protein